MDLAKAEELAEDDPKRAEAIRKATEKRTAAELAANNRLLALRKEFLAAAATPETRAAFQIANGLTTEQVARIESMASQIATIETTSATETDKQKKESQEKLTAALRREAIEAKRKLIAEEQDLDKQARDFALLDLESKLQDELAANKNNAAKRIQLERDAAKARVKIEQDYMRQTNRLFDLAMQVREAIEEGAARKREDRAKEEASKRLSEIQKLQDDLVAAVIRGDKTLQNYYDETAKLAAERQELELQGQVAAQTKWQQILANLDNSAREAGKIASTKFADDQQKRTEKTLNDEVDLKRETQDRIAKLIEMGADTETATTMATEEAKQDSRADGDKKWIDSLTSVFAITTQVMAEGGSAQKGLFKGILAASFDMLQSMLPVWIAGIAGVEFSTKGLAGAPLVGIAVAVLQGLVSAAKAAVLGAFRDGVVGVQGPGTGTSDSILARISAGESVITERGTKAGSGRYSNAAALEYVNRTGRPLVDFFRPMFATAAFTTPTFTVPEFVAPPVANLAINANGELISVARDHVQATRENTRSTAAKLDRLAREQKKTRKALERYDASGSTPQSSGENRRRK